MEIILFVWRWILWSSTLFQPVVEMQPFWPQVPNWKKIIFQKECVICGEYKLTCDNKNRDENTSYFWWWMYQRKKLGMCFEKKTALQ